MADRRAVFLAGLLFLNAILFLFVGEALYRPWLDPLDLDGVAAHRSGYLTGVLLEWTASVPLILMIPVLLFPIFAEHSMRAAVAYLALRLMEVTLLTVADTVKLGLLSLATWEDRAMAEALARAGLELAAWIDSAGTVYNLVFGASALVLFGLLFQTHMVPRLLAGFGFIATLILMLGSVIFSFDLVAPAFGPAFWGPIALAEISLGLWLMAKGIDTEH
ncbi:MAG: DUF4386 domain-containing protein [Paracoccaceae bacterium]|nr:DUF4386 domain-containing protein [Paracoccaceae bacterium]